MNARYLLQCLLCLFALASQGQQNVQISNPVPVSPQAASFAKYGEIPVSLSSGLPTISIPIENITHGDISLPIALSYHAGGIRVEEIASNVGIGWTLSYGGIVSRQTRALPDDSPFGFETTGADVRNYMNGQMTNNQTQSFLTDLRNGHVDGERDIFSFSTADGQSGKFFQDDEGNFVCFPKSNLKIERYVDNGKNCWKITGDNGTSYYFLHIEMSSTVNISISTPGGANYETGMTNEPTSWYLTKIQDVKGNEVNFSYNANWVGFQTKAQETKRVRLISTGSYFDCDESYFSSYVASSSHTPRIKEIAWPNGKLKFSYLNSGRLDLLQDTALSTIELVNGNGEVVSKTKFSTSYFESNSNYTEDQSVRYRLRLDSINKADKGNYLLPAHKFVYRNNTGMAERTSNSQDYWGFYNGRSNNEFVAYFYPGPNDTKIAAGADKRIDTAKTKELILTEIGYPTGGKTNFEYEGNSYSKYKDAYYSYNTSPIAAIGVNNSGGEEHQVLYESTEPFTLTSGDINNTSGTVTLRVAKWGGCDNPNNYFCVSEAKLLPATGSPISLVDNSVIELAPGSYTLYARVETEYAGIPYANSGASLTKGVWNPGGYYEEPSGGLRIKRIYNFEGNGIAGIKEYSYNTIGASASSGTINNYNVLPNYNRIEVRRNAKYEPLTDSYSYYDCVFDVYSSVSNYPFNNINGGTTVYANVTVTEKSISSGTNGKTEHFFTTHDDYGDFINTGFPFPSAAAFDWKRGLPKLVREYKQNTNNTYSLVREKYSYFAFHDHQEDTTRILVSGLKTGQLEFIDIPPGTPGYIGTTIPALNALLINAPYHIISEIFYLQKDSTIEYEAASVQSLHTIDSFVYKLSPILLSKKITTNSKGHQTELGLFYPSDYLHVPIFLSMEDKNMVTPVVSVVNQNKSLNKELSRQYTGFTSWHTGIPLPDTISASLNGNVLETEKIATRYLPNGKLEELKDRTGFYKSYVWGYNDEYVIAEATNVLRKDIFHTSFEDEDGNSTYGDAKAGKRSRAGGFTRALTGLSNGNYKLSYWVKSGGNWALQQSVVAVGSGVYTINIEGQIDDVRFHPVSAQMVTYTYTPLVGVTSVADVNMQFTFYFYDTFNRLHLIKDKDGNITKKICYNYAGQIVSCDMYSSSNQSGTFTRNNCGDGYAGGTYFVEIPEGMFISGVSQADADAQALAYGQAQANLYGSCSVSAVSIISNNNVNEGNFEIRFYNESTAELYTTYSSYGYDISLGTVPPGTYTITIIPSDTLTMYSYMVGCSSYGGGYTYTFYGVSISPTCRTIDISY